MYKNKNIHIYYIILYLLSIDVIWLCVLCITPLRSLKYLVASLWARRGNMSFTKLVHLIRISIIPLVSSPSLPRWSEGHWLANDSMPSSLLSWKIRAGKYQHFYTYCETRHFEALAALNICDCLNVIKWGLFILIILEIRCFYLGYDICLRDIC